MRLPDCRTDDYYSVENLDEQDRAELNGFDWCAEEVVDRFFDNDMFDLADPETYLGHVLCEEVPELMRERYRMNHAFGDRQPEEREVITYADLIRMKLLEWIESDRNEMIVSMIEAKESDDDE